MNGSFRNSCDVFLTIKQVHTITLLEKLPWKRKVLICFSSRESSNSQTWLIPVSADWLFIFHWSWEGSSIYFGEAQLALWEGGWGVEKDKYHNLHFAAWLAWSMGWRWTNNLGNALCSPRVYYVSRRINNFDGISAWNAVLQPPCHILGDGRENNIEWKEKTHWQKQFMSVIFFLNVFN